MRPRFLAAAVLAALAPLSVLVAAPADAASPLPTLGSVKDVLVQSDGRIVVAFQTAATDRFTVLRLGIDGTLDSTFGGDGIVETVLDPTRHSIVHDIALEPNGRIVAAGHVMTDVNDSNFALVRYRTDGSLDPTFSGDGMVITDFVTGNGWNPAIDLTADGSIVAAGSETANLGVLVSRYRADGSLDTAFDQDGLATFDLPGAWDHAFDVAVDASGNAFVAGRIKEISQTPEQMVAKVRPDGQLDGSFGTGGLLLWDSGHGGIQTATSLDIQGDGRIVVAGLTGYDDYVTLSRYLPNGQADPAFGTAGHVVSHLAGYNYDNDPGVDVVLLRDGRIAVSGTSGVPDTDLRLAMHAANGAYDPAFDADDGIVMLDLGAPGGDDWGGSMAMARNGTLIVAGTHGTASDSLGTLEVVGVPSLAPIGDVSVTVGATPNPAPAGPVEFQVRVRNDGPMEATGVALTFEASQSTGPGVPSRGACKSPLPRTTTCTFGAIPVGAEVLVTVGTSVSGTEEGLFGTATVTSTSVDPDTGDNSSTVEVLIAGPNGQ